MADAIKSSTVTPVNDADSAGTVPSPKSRAKSPSSGKRPGPRATAPAEPKPDARTTVYTQDVQFYLYLDGLKWSRFQTTSAIEAATLYALYAAAGLNPIEKLVLVVFSALLIWLLMGLAWADERRSRSHLNRIEEYETKIAKAPYEKPRPRSLGVKVMWVASSLITVFNLLLVAKYLKPFL